jgi:hypothetical protein
MMNSTNTRIYSLSELIRLLKLEVEINPDLTSNELKALPAIQLFVQTGLGFFTIADYEAMEYLYVSPSVKTITGYSSDSWMEGGTQFCFNLYHPDDHKLHREVHKKIFDFHCSIPYEERLKYRYSYDSRVKRSDGKYIRLLVQMVFLKIDEMGKPLLGYELATDISSFKKDNKMTLSINKYDDSSGFTDIILDFSPEEINGILSKRENEINQLIRKGFTSREIAEKLCLSKNTVDTHRRKIIHKLNLQFL